MRAAQNTHGIYDMVCYSCLPSVSVGESSAPVVVFLHIQRPLEIYGFTLWIRNNLYKVGSTSFDTNLALNHRHYRLGWYCHSRCCGSSWPVPVVHSARRWLVTWREMWTSPWFCMASYVVETFSFNHVGANLDIPGSHPSRVGCRLILAVKYIQCSKRETMSFIVDAIPTLKRRTPNAIACATSRRFFKHTISSLAQYISATTSRSFSKRGVWWGRSLRCAPSERRAAR